MKKYLGFASVLLLLTSLGGNALAGANLIKLRLLETTDIHVHILPYDYYKDGEDPSVGLARTATLIEQAASEVPNHLLIDNGDLIQGNPLGDYVAKEKGLKPGDVHPVYKAMNLLDYAVGNIGNHEFNYGLDYLETSLAGAKFPYVSANVFKDDGDGNPANDKPYFTPYVILDRMLKDELGRPHPIKIGVIGFVPPQILQWDRSNLLGKVTTRDIVETAKLYVPEMRQKGADLVIAVPHSGFAATNGETMQENATYDLSKVAGIDAILFGHAHQVFPGETYAGFPGADIAKGQINGVPAVMPGFWGSHLGIIDLTLSIDDKGVWSVIEGQGTTRSIYKTEDRKKIPLVESHAKIVAAVQADHEAALAYVRKPIGATSAPINSYFALVQDDPSIQIVTNAQKAYVDQLLKGSEYDGIPVLSAGAPFKAGGRGGPDYFTDIPAGELAVKSAADLYLYPNTLRAVMINGAGVKEWLEMSAGAFNQIDPKKAEAQALLNPDFPSYNFDVIDGVMYEIDVTQPARYNKDGALINPDAQRIKNLTFNGKPIDPNQKFIVATNNYRAGGGGKFPGLDGKNIIVEAPDENRTVLINYIYDQKTINPSADNNWRLAQVPAKVTFPSSAKAASLLNGQKAMTASGETPDGFTLYTLDLSAR